MNQVISKLPTWGYVFLIFVALGAIWLVQFATYVEGQEWSPTWEGICEATWEALPTDEEPAEDEEPKEPEMGLMILCGEEKFPASKDFTIDYYRAEVQNFNCMQSQGAFTRNLKWDCSIGESNG